MSLNVFHLSPDEFLLIIFYMIRTLSRPLALQMTTTHKDAVTYCCYNASFNHVVTSSEHSVIKVWDIENGDQVFEYSNIHDQMAVTAMCFDSSERRLVRYLISFLLQSSARLSYPIQASRLSCHYSLPIH